MIPLLVTAALAAPTADGYEVVVRTGDTAYRLGLVIDTPAGPLLAREPALLAGWTPTGDGSDPLDPLLPDGRLLRVETLPPSPHTEPLTRAIFATLDRDHDGKLARDELRAAANVLLDRFDADGDGCLTPLELVPDLLTAAPKALAPSGSASVFRPGEPRPQGLAELANVMTLRVGTTSRAVIRDRRSGLTIDVAVTGPSTAPELPKALLQPGRETERKRFTAVAREVMTLTARPQARGWFELLDADCDGQLSVRELRAAWHVLAGDGPTIGFVRAPDPAERTVSVTLTPGVETRPAVQLVPSLKAARGPVWFQGLDRNRDGDVSRQEFVGTDAQFKRYDADGDGLISAAEAEAGDRLFRNGGTR